MFIVSGACDSMPYETTTHEYLDDAIDAAVQLLKDGYNVSDAEMWGDDGLAACYTEFTQVRSMAHDTLGRTYSDGGPVNNLYRFGSRDSAIFGHDADATDHPYFGPDWFVAIVRY